MPIPVGAPEVSTTDGVGVPGALLHDGSVTLGDITIGATDDFGVEWILESLTGWFDAPPTTGDVEQRAADSGGWATPAYYAPRVIEITGSILAANWDACSRALSRLYGSVPLSELDTLYVTENAETLQADVRQDGDPLTERSGGWARFSLSLIAPDPRRYEDSLTQAMAGLATTSGGLSLGGTGLTLNTTGLSVGATVSLGTLSATNSGNMATRPILTVFGPCDPFTLTHRQSGKTLRFSEAIAAGRALVIDTDKRRALLDGVAPRTVTGTWFEYAPGLNEVSFSATSYNFQALLTSSHRSAWR